MCEKKRIILKGCQIFFNRTLHRKLIKSTFDKSKYKETYIKYSFYKIEGKTTPNNQYKTN